MLSRRKACSNGATTKSFVSLSTVFQMHEFFYKHVWLIYSWNLFVYCWIIEIYWIVNRYIVYREIAQPSNCRNVTDILQVFAALHIVQRVTFDQLVNRKCDFSHFLLSLCCGIYFVLILVRVNREIFEFSFEINRCVTNMAMEQLWFSPCASSNSLPWYIRVMLVMILERKEIFQVIKLGTNITHFSF